MKSPTKGKYCQKGGMHEFERVKDKDDVEWTKCRKCGEGSKSSDLGEQRDQRPVETTLKSALKGIEQMPQDKRLTQAATFIEKALDLVSGFLDEVAGEAIINRSDTDDADAKA